MNIICKAKNCCNAEWKLEPYVEYFRFPTDPETRNTWAERANVSPEEIDDDSVLCSEHFDEHCFDRSQLTNIKLKENALPTIFEQIFTSDVSATPQLEINVAIETSPTDSQVDQQTVGDPTTQLDPITGEEIEIKTEVCDGYNEVLYVTSIDGAVHLHSNDETRSESNDVKPLLPKARKKPAKSAKPRKVKAKKVSIKKALASDASVTLGTPHEIQCLLGEVKVLKTTCLKQLAKIKTLQQKIRRSNQHSEKLKENIKDFKAQNEELKKNLENYSTLPNISALCNDLMKRQLAIKEGRELERVYPQEVRDFAISLNSFSPLAYRYVRESFNKVLPHKKTLIKWLRAPDMQVKQEPSTTPPPSFPQLPTQSAEVTEEMLIEISAQLEEPNADLFNYVEQYFPLTGQPIPNQVKIVLTENGFNHLVSLMALKDQEIEAMIEKNPDLPDGHMAYLRRLPQLLQEMSQKMSEPNETPTASPPKKPAPKTNTSFQVDRSSIVLKSLVCDWLNKNTETESPYEKAHIHVTVDSTAMPFCGTIRCVICLQDINVNMQKYKKSETYIRWVIANFIKHFKKFHITKSTEIFLEPLTTGDYIEPTIIAPIKEKKRRAKPIKILPKPSEKLSDEIKTDNNKRLSKRVKVEPEQLLAVESEKTEDMVEIEYMDGISVANIFGNMFYTND